MDNKAILRAFLDAAERGDRAAMDAILAPDVVVIEAPSLPFGGRHVGIEAFHALVRRVFLLWHDTRLEVERLIGEGDDVVVLATMHARSKADGAELEMPMVELWRFDGGRVREIRPFYLDTARFSALLKGDAAGG